jgi:hypothetical protein
LKLNRGDWAIIHGYYETEYNGVLCEILHTSFETGKYKVRPAPGHKLGRISYMHADFLKKAPPSLEPEDYEALRSLYMELALATKDYKWCNQLGGNEDEI